MRTTIASWIAPALAAGGLALILAGFPHGAQLPGRPVQAQAAGPASCTGWLANGGFETDDAWNLPNTAYRAAYSSEQAHDGARSLRAGIVAPRDNRFSFSSAFQVVQLPAGAQTITLSFWWFPISGEGEAPDAAATGGPADAAAEDEAARQALAGEAALAAPLAGDRQYALVTDENNNLLQRLMWTRTDAQAWRQAAFDLTGYAGMTVRIHVGVYNDGEDGVTAMYVDDATVIACQAEQEAGYLPLIRTSEVSATATMTATATVAPSPTPTATVAPTATLVWTAPAQAIEVFSPVAGGLYHSPIQVHGFSQTFEGSVNIRLTDQMGQVLAERNTLGGSVDGFDFFNSYVRFTVSEPVSATLEVFEISAKDGSEIHKVQIPLALLPGQRVIDLNTPVVGATVCNPLVVAGYSNTFEATLAVSLHARNGDEITRTIAMGGNLGVYADFFTTISTTVAAPQPVLVSAFEESAAGFGPIDNTRVPVSLYPNGADACP